MASTSNTTVTSSPHLHSDLPPWKIELIQRKKKLNTTSTVISSNASIQRTIMQFDNSNDGNFGKCLIIIKVIRSKQILPASGHHRRCQTHPFNHPRIHGQTSICVPFEWKITKTN